MKKNILVLAIGLLLAPLATQATLVDKGISSESLVKNSVKEVIDNYIKATGGEAKMKAVRNMEMNMEAEIQGMKLNMFSVIDRENKRLVNVTEMNGSVVSKTVLKDGAGKVTAMGQEQVLTGDQLAGVENQIYAFRELYIDELGMNVTYGGTAEVEGEQAHKLIIDADGDAATTEYYSVDSGLKLQTESKAAGIISYKDYEEVDGLMMPMTMVITNSMMPMPLEAKIISIEFNKDLDDSVFN